MPSSGQGLVPPYRPPALQALAVALELDRSMTFWLERTAGESAEMA
jgi:hypothetical protein